MNTLARHSFFCAVALLASQALHAEPVTLMFTGVVDYRSEYAPASIQVGSQASGQIAFDTATLPSQPSQTGPNLQITLFNVTQPGAFELKVGDQTVKSSDLLVKVRDVTGASTTYEQIAFDARDVTINGQRPPAMGGVLNAPKVGLDLRTGGGVESVMGATLPATLRLEDFVTAQGGMALSVAVEDGTPGSGFWSITYQLTSISAVPEASAWSSMAVGLLMIGALARSRRWPANR